MKNNYERIAWTNSVCIAGRSSSEWCVLSFVLNGVWLKGVWGDWVDLTKLTSHNTWHIKTEDRELFAGGSVISDKCRSTQRGKQSSELLNIWISNSVGNILGSWMLAGCQGNRNNAIACLGLLWNGFIFQGFFLFLVAIFLLANC